MQRGCMQRNSRKEGPDVWQFRWSETRLDGTRLATRQQGSCHMDSAFWSSTSQDGQVASVDPSDLRTVWSICHTEYSHAPDQQFAIGLNAFKVVCSPDANIHAIWYRAVLLELLCVRMGLLSRWLQNAELDETVFRVAAIFPIEKPQAGAGQQGLPLDVQSFLKQIEEQANSDR